LTPRENIVTVNAVFSLPKYPIPTQWICTLRRHDKAVLSALWRQRMVEWYLDADSAVNKWKHALDRKHFKALIEFMARFFFTGAKLLCSSKYMYCTVKNTTHVYQRIDEISIDISSMRW